MLEKWLDKKITTNPFINWVRPLKLIGEMVETRTKERLDAGINPDGTEFKKLSAMTIKLRKNKDKSSIKPLIDTSAMLRSIHATPPDINDNSVDVKVGVEYAHKHQFGIDVPKREILDLRSEDTEESVRITEIVEEFADKYLRDIFDV